MMRVKSLSDSLGKTMDGEASGLSVKGDVAKVIRELKFEKEEEERWEAAPG